jgi:hypothetical protein
LGLVKSEAALLKFRTAKRTNQVVDGLVRKKKQRARLSKLDSLSVNGVAVERVREMQYLGSRIIADGNGEEEIRERVRLAFVAFGKVRKVVTNSGLSSRIKLRLLHAYVTTVLLYGCEAWHVKGIRVKGILAPLEYKIWALVKPAKGISIKFYERYQRRKCLFLGHVMRSPLCPEFRHLFLPSTRSIIEEDLGMPVEKALCRAANRGAWSQYVQNRYLI